MSFKEVKLKVLKHELGHWLMARHVGFRVGDIEISINSNMVRAGARNYTQDGSSWVYPAPVVRCVEDLKTYLESRFQVLYAGIAAQIHGQSMTPDESGKVMEQDAASDLRIIRELSPILRGMVYGDETSADDSERQILEMLDPIWERTVSLISEFYPKLDWMAKDLSQRLTVSDRKYVLKLDSLEHLENQFQG